MDEPGGRTVFKLCRKYGDGTSGAESITNLYLSAAEHALLATLPGWSVSERRYRRPEGGLDHYHRGADAV